MTLNEWHERLEKHFSGLKAQRLSSNSHVFALEHGLNPQELGSLQSAIGEFSKHTTPSSKHWLAWVVYATEVGYSYSGDEYWQTFGERTPGWNAHNQNIARDDIRDSFWRFRKEYLGVTPNGRWAKHFSIICWPITHAILPQDLQKQLAEILFDIRHEYDEQLLSDPERLGDCIDGASWKASSRFQQFAEQHLLVGQIAAALLLTEEEREKGLILPVTLKRIASDLDRERRSREWLSDARKQAFTVRVGGLSRGNTARGHQHSESLDLSPREQLVRLGVEPTLALRRLGRSEWEVRLQLPSFAPLLLKFPKFKQYLAGERSHIFGAKDKRPIARERLLFGTQEVPLARWPSIGEVLLRFDHSCPELDHLLHTECLLRPGHRWIFKIGDDGTGVEIRTATIRPGAEYIVLAATLPAFVNIQAERVTISCEGIYGALIRVPETVNYKATKEFEGLGLSVASSLDCWPVGIPPAKWDDEGAAEYLTGSSPCIAIAADFQSTGTIVNLVGPSPAQLQLASNLAEEPVMIDLGPLSTGSHILNIITAHERYHVTASLRISIREPLPPSSPVDVISVLMSPANSSLEQLWDGTATIEVYAPEETKIQCEAVFYKDIGCSNRLGSRQFGPLKAPITSDLFGGAFTAVRTAMQNTYDEAGCCVLKFGAGQLGDYSVRCERQPCVCRWAVRRENQAYWLHLVQSDQLASPKFFSASFSSPDVLTPIRALQFEPRLRVPDEGGLYYAAVNEHGCVVVIPPIIRSLQDLKLRTLVVNRKRTEQDVSQVLRAFELWSTARIVGDPFSASRKVEVLSLLHNWITAALCGDQRNGDNTVSGAQAKVAVAGELIQRKHPGLAAALARIVRNISSYPFELAAEILTQNIKAHLALPNFSLAREHGVSSLQWLTEFGLRLFSEPDHVRQWAGEEFTSGVHYLLTQRSVAHLCRYVSLVRRESRTPVEELVDS